MNYYGRILRADLLTAAQAGQMIKASLSQMYQQGRFLGGFEHTEDDLTSMPAKAAWIIFMVVRSSATGRKLPMSCCITAA